MHAANAHKEASPVPNARRRTFSLMPMWFEYDVTLPTKAAKPTVAKS